MAEEFQAAICSGSWWMSPRTAFNHSSCSSVIADMENFGHSWPRDLMNLKSKSASEESSDDSMVTNTISPDSAFQMMATAFSSSLADTSMDWNQNLLLEHEGLNTFSTSGDDGSTVVTEADQQGFTMDQQQSLNLTNSSSDCTTFPINSTTYAYPSSLLQSYLNCNSPSQPLYDFPSNSNNFDCVQSSSSIRPKQVPTNFQLTNNTTFWNTSTSSVDDNISSIFSSPSSQSYKEKGRLPNLTTKPNYQEILGSGSTAKKGSSDFKRPRLETPSPLPTFKVRKEKLGDRITALQQLVSPFGKTDTASVLHEAIEYIKLLHDQVNILSAPYMKNGATKQFQQIHTKVKDVEGDAHDLRSLGLCLVPVSSTFPVANEMANGFWTPCFEGSLR